MLLKRLVLTRDIEVFEVKKGLYSDVSYYMIFVDLRRPSRYSDFSYISGFEEEDFCERANCIQAFILYDNDINEQEKEMTYEIASGFLEDKDECDWFLKYIKADFDELRPIGGNGEVLIIKINEFLSKQGIQKNLGDINLKDFKYLSQG